MPFNVQSQCSPDDSIDRTRGVKDARLAGSVTSDQIASEETGTRDSEMLRAENQVTARFYLAEHPICQLRPSGLESETCPHSSWSVVVAAYESSYRVAAAYGFECRD